MKTIFFTQKEYFLPAPYLVWSGWTPPYRPFTSVCHNDGECRREREIFAESEDRDISVG